MIYSSDLVAGMIVHVRFTKAMYMSQGCDSPQISFEYKMELKREFWEKLEVFEDWWMLEAKMLKVI